MGKKFVGLDGLKHFWTKVKTWIAGQITSEVTAKIAEIVANAPEDLDTLKEIADWIKTHANDASAMNTQINTNKNDIAALQTSVAGKADTGHTHDDIYYTESEVDKKLAGKSNVEHTHTKSEITDFAHTHDDRYFTETEVTSKLAGKSDTGHTHTKSQITDFPTSLPANGGNADTVDNYHASDLWRSDGATWDPNANVSLGAKANGDEWSFDISRNGKTGCYWHVWDSTHGSLLKVNADDGKVSAPKGFKASSKMVIPIGEPSQLEDGCIWIER